MLIKADLCSPFPVLPHVATQVLLMKMDTTIPEDVPEDEEMMYLCVCDVNT